MNSWKNGIEVNIMTKVFAHRGASGYEPENTLKAFKEAYEEGADGIELDVQLSKDGKVMIMHDEKLSRVTGKKGWLKDYMAADLVRMAVRSGLLNNSAKIPSLEEVLRWAQPLNLEINIEFKTGVFAYPGIEEKVISMVKQMGMEKRVIY
jgi:glycerophosphoryl diester phosphodiesterase